MGRAEGHGLGEGHSAGSEGSGVVAGASVAVCCTVFFCICGVPVLIAGVILLLLRFSQNLGIVLICVAIAFALIGFVLSVLLCSGHLSKKNRTAPQGMTVVNQTNIISGVQPQTIQYNQTIMPPAYTESRNPPPYNENYPVAGHAEPAYPPTAPVGTGW